MCTDKNDFSLFAVIGLVFEIGTRKPTYFTRKPGVYFEFLNRFIDVCNIYCLVESMVTQTIFKKDKTSSVIFAHET